MDLVSEFDKKLTAADRQKADDAVNGFAWNGEKLFNVIPVPKGTEMFAAALAPTLVTAVTNKAINFADRFHPNGGKIASLVVPGLIYAQEPLGKVLQYRKDIRKFDNALQPLFKANKEGKSGIGRLFDSGERSNAIIEFARQQVHARHLNGMVGSSIKEGLNFGVTQVMSRPDLLSKVRKQGEDFLGEEITEFFMEVGNNLEKEESKSGNHKGGLKNQKISPSVTLLLGTVSKSLEGLVKSRLPKRFDGICSLDACNQFIAAMDGAAKNFDPLDQRDTERELRAQSNKIVEIFKLRYRESGWGKMPERITEKLEEIVPQLARPMLTGELSPRAIINLAGEDKILQENGQAVASANELAAALDEQMHKLSRHSQLSVAEFTSETELKLSDVVAVWKDLKPEESALLACIIPDVVLQKAGMPKDEMAEFRKVGEKNFSEVAQTIIDDLAKRPAEEMRDYFSKSEITFIRKLSNSLTEIDKNPRQRKDDLDALDEKDNALKNAAVERILAKAYVKVEKPRHWSKLLEEKEAEEEKSHVEKHAKKKPVEAEHEVAEDKADHRSKIRHEREAGEARGSHREA